MHVCLFPILVLVAHAGHITCLMMHMCFAWEWNIHTFVYQCNSGVSAQTWWTRNVCAFRLHENRCLTFASVMLLIVRLSFFSWIGLPHRMQMSPFQGMEIKSEESQSKFGQDHQNDLEHICTCCHACWYVLDVCCCCLICWTFGW